MSHCAWYCSLVSFASPGFQTANLSVLYFLVCLTPQAGFEPATNRLTVDRSTTELLRNAPISYSKAKSRIWQVLLENFLDFFLETRNTNICKSLRFTLPLNDHEETANKVFNAAWKRSTGHFTTQNSALFKSHPQFS